MYIFWMNYGKISKDNGSHFEWWKKLLIKYAFTACHVCSLKLCAVTCVASIAIALRIQYTLIYRNTFFVIVP